VSEKRDARDRLIVANLQKKPMLAEPNLSY
jgi:hypothetical protein